jgi:hypothetical protein
MLIGAVSVSRNSDVAQRGIESKTLEHLKQLRGQGGGRLTVVFFTSNKSHEIQDAYEHSETRDHEHNSTLYRFK